MKYGIRNSQEPSHNTEKSRLLDRQGWVQTLGGVTVLFVIPVFVALGFSPDVHAWVRSLVSPHPRSTETAKSSQQPRQFLFPNSILKIAEISEVKQDVMPTGSMPMPDSSLAMQRLQRTLQAHADWKMEDVFRAANREQSGTGMSPCPFESISGERSLVLGKGANGDISLAKTLDRCAEAVEQVATVRNRSDR